MVIPMIPEQNSLLEGMIPETAQLMFLHTNINRQCHRVTNHSTTLYVVYYLLILYSQRTAIQSGACFVFTQNHMVIPRRHG